MRFFPTAARFFCRAPALRRMLRHANRHRITILMYHGVTAEPLGVNNWCHMPVAEFAAQMEFVAAHYNLLPLSEVVNRLTAHTTLPDHPACVTFDDGFLNILRNALPVLDKHNIPFTVFITTQLAETKAPPWPEEVFSALLRSTRSSFTFQGKSLPLSTAGDRKQAFEKVMQLLKSTATADRQRLQDAVMRDIAGDLAEAPADETFATLDWHDIANLAQTGLAEFGSHTHSHEILTNCSPDEQRRQLDISHRLLLDHLGRCDLLAYPNGDYSDTVKKMAREAGYRAAVTTEHVLNHADVDVYALGRIGVGAGWSMERFEIKVLGY